MAETFADQPVPRPARGTKPLQGLRYQLGKLVFSTPVYGLTLSRRAPDAPKVTPPDPWPGNADRGNAILRDRFSFANSIDKAVPEWPFLEFTADELAEYMASTGFATCARSAAMHRVAVPATSSRIG